MRFKKIPKTWLIHTVALVTLATESGAFGDTDVTESRTIERVRITEPKRELTVTANNEQFSVNAVLVHQPGVSTECTFRVGEYLRFEGQLYEIVGVDPVYELTKLHHTEVKLRYVNAYQR